MVFIAKSFREESAFIEMTTNDAWFRDTGATFVTDGAGGKRAVDWHFNAYGGLIDGLYFPWDADDQIAAKMAQGAYCLWAGFAPWAQVSVRCGQPIQTRSCGANSAGMEKPSAAGVESDS